jgi:capsid protein
VSMQDVEANYGRDIDEVFEQISLEKELAANYGLSMAFEPFGQKMQAPPIITGSE